MENVHGLQIMSRAQAKRQKPNKLTFKDGEITWIWENVINACIPE